MEEHEGFLGGVCEDTLGGPSAAIAFDHFEDVLIRGCLVSVKGPPPEAPESPGGLISMILMNNY